MRTAKKIGLTFLGMAMPVVVTIVSVPLFLTQIGGARYGALAIAWLVLGYVGQADFGMSRAITQRIASLRASANGDRQGAAAIWSAGVIATGIGLLGACLVYAGMRYFFAGTFQVDAELVKELEGTVLLLALSTPLVNYYSVAIGALLGAERTQTVAVFNALSAIALQLFPLAAAYTISVDLTVLVAAAFIARLGFTVPAIAACWLLFLKGHPIRTSRQEIGNLGRFGVWVMVTALVGPLMIITDRFLIGAVLGAVAVAAYTIPYQIANRTLMLPYAVMQVMFPRFAAESSADAHANAGQYMVYLGTVYAVVAIAIIALAEPLMRLWLGAALDERSIIIAQIIMIGLWANAIAQVPFGFLQARGNPRFTGLLHVAELPLYIALLASLGFQFGLTGIAWAFTLRCVGDLLALSYKAQLLKRSILFALLPPTVFILVSFAAIRVWQHPIAPYVTVVAIGGASVIWAWLSLPITVRRQLVDRLLNSGIGAFLFRRP
jgi:O-antigen/teichoic acid export membrane protein